MMGGVENRTDTEASLATRIEDETIAAGIKVFKRTDRLEKLLATIPPEIVSTVYVADDGPEDQKSERRKRFYDSEYPFELRVLDLEYDTGLSYGRSRIVDVFTEDYLLMLDSDMKVPPNVGRLYELLRANPGLGGVAGCLAEPHKNRIVLMGADFDEANNRIAIDPFLHDKQIEFTDDYPLVAFDWIQNVALFRQECLLDYSWDPNFLSYGFEHLDFFLGHWKLTNWSFAVCPQVVFPHFPGGSDEYLAHRQDRQNEPKIKKLEAYFLEKWGYKSVNERGYYWYEGGRRPAYSPANKSLLKEARRIHREEGPATLAKRTSGYLMEKLYSSLL